MPDALHQEVRVTFARTQLGRTASGLLKTIVVGLAIAQPGGASSASAQAFIYHATSSGQEALDQGQGGGNPFASALIELLARPRLSTAELSRDLKGLTFRKSGGFQTADVAQMPESVGWTPKPKPPGESRLALVLVVSDYSLSGGAPSLPGAAHDARRIAVALQEAGFETEVALNLDLETMRAALARFSARSASVDAAAIYTTGHGVEHKGQVFLVPGDYALDSGSAGLSGKALALSEIAQAPRARLANIVFYGGCRNNPLGD